MRRKHTPIVFDSLVRPTRYNFKDITGRRFNLLTVDSFAGVANLRSYWTCVCDCGQKTVLFVGDLTVGHTKSCGCIQANVTADRNKRMATHGESSPMTVEFKTWSGLFDRCDNPKDKRYHYYGAMGVTICARWRESYENFLADMGRRPSSTHSIDRWPDPYGNYDPRNCRWATKREQAQNRRPSTRKGNTNVCNKV